MTVDEIAKNKYRILYKALISINLSKMSPQIKLTVTQNNKLLHTVTKTVEKQHFIKSLEEFQLEANAGLTKLITELGETVGDANMDEDDEDEDTDDDAGSLQSTDKESNGHSKSKRKKHL